MVRTSPFRSATSRWVLAGLATATLMLSGAQAAPPSPPPASAPSAAPAQGVYRFTVGRFVVTALSDGTLPLPAKAVLHGASSAQIDAALAAGFRADPLETSINAYLVEAGDRLFLVDTGAGQLFDPARGSPFGKAGGRLLQSMAAAGYRPEQVTDVLLTHIHSDHSGGLVIDGAAAFPNAVVHAPEGDAALFLDRRGDTRKIPARFFDEAREALGPYQARGKLDRFTGPKTFGPGVASEPLAGHTPGHTAYRISDGDQSLFFWGDLVHAAAVQMPDPKVTIAFDADEPAARTQRDATLARLARERQLVAGAHIDFPGLGYVRPDGQGYVFVPAVYRQR